MTGEILPWHDPVAVADAVESLHAKGERDAVLAGIVLPGVLEELVRRDGERLFDPNEVVR